MQTVIHVVCKGTKSLRDAITNDGEITEHHLQLVQCKRQHRSPGWAKLTSVYGGPGAINFKWDASSRALTCRVVTRNRNKPYSIVGDFLAYLLAKHSRRIVTILISWAK